MCQTLKAWHADFNLRNLFFFLLLFSLSHFKHTLATTASLCIDQNKGGEYTNNLGNMDKSFQVA